MSDVKKYEELIKMAFDWYYQEGMHVTNIGNDEAMILFLDTEIFKDWYKANEANTGDNGLILPRVINL